jgi:uncharacterized protein (TIGR03083 family)
MTQGRHRLNGSRYIALVEEKGEELARAAEKDLDAAVPGCPGWSVDDLVWHTGEVHFFWATIAREQLQDPKLVVRPERPPKDEVVGWYRSNLGRLIEALTSSDPAASVWTWTSEKNIAWIRRRMAHETAVHAWDARSATETPPPIDRDLAVDGIDEFLEYFVTEPGAVNDVSVHLHTTDAEGEWMAEIAAERLEVRREHARADVAVRGDASSLLLLLWGRVPEAEVEVHGDRAALFRFLEAADLS